LRASSGNSPDQGAKAALGGAKFAGGAWHVLRWFVRATEAASKPSSKPSTSSVQTRRFSRVFGPNVVAMATAAASRPRALSPRPIRAGCFARRTCTSRSNIGFKPGCKIHWQRQNAMPRCDRIAAKLFLIAGPSRSIDSRGETREPLRATAKCMQESAAHKSPKHRQLRVSDRPLPWPQGNLFSETGLTIHRRRPAECI
jgi:hypothetical protein